MNVYRRPHKRLCRDCRPTRCAALFASVMFALGESIPIVMADGGWSDPKVVLTVYAHSMRRDDQENEALRALVEGSPIGSNGNSVESTLPSDQMEGAL